MEALIDPLSHIGQCTRARWSLFCVHIKSCSWKGNWIWWWEYEGSDNVTTLWNRFQSNGATWTVTTGSVFATPRVSPITLRVGHDWTAPIEPFSAAKEVTTRGCVQVMGQLRHGGCSTSALFCSSLHFASCSSHSPFSQLCTMSSTWQLTDEQSFRKFQTRGLVLHP